MDVLSIIQQYQPDIDVGLSNERLFEEIRSIDPIFSLEQFYSDLYRWKKDQQRFETNEIQDIIFQYPPWNAVLHEKNMYNNTDFLISEFVVSDSEEMREQLQDIDIQVQNDSTVSIDCEQDEPLKPIMDGIIYQDRLSWSHPLFLLSAGPQMFSTGRYYYKMSNAIPIPRISIGDTFSYRVLKAIQDIDNTITMYEIYRIKYITYRILQKRKHPLFDQLKDSVGKIFLDGNDLLVKDPSFKQERRKDFQYIYDFDGRYTPMDDFGIIPNAKDLFLQLILHDKQQHQYDINNISIGDTYSGIVSWEFLY